MLKPKIKPLVLEFGADTNLWGALRGRMGRVRVFELSPVVRGTVHITQVDVTGSKPERICTDLSFGEGLALVYGKLKVYPPGELKKAMAAQAAQSAAWLAAQETHDNITA